MIVGLLNQNWSLPSVRRGGGGSFIEVMLTMLLISISLGATFKLNTTAAQEMRYSHKSYFVNNALTGLIESSRIAYEPSIRDVFTLSGENTAYKTDTCLKDCSAELFAKSRIREWAESVSARLGEFKYNLVLDNEDELEVSVAWKSARVENQVSSGCAIPVADDENCFETCCTMKN